MEIPTDRRSPAPGNAALRADLIWVRWHSRQEKSAVGQRHWLKLQPAQTVHGLGDTRPLAAVGVAVAHRSQAPAHRGRRRVHASHRIRASRRTSRRACSRQRWRNPPGRGAVPRSRGSPCGCRGSTSSLVRQWCRWSRLTRVNVIKPMLCLVRNRHPDGLHRQTGPVGHAAQFPADCVPAGVGEQLGEHVPDEGVAPHIVRQDQLRLTQCPHRVVATSPQPR